MPLSPASLALVLICMKLVAKVLIDAGVLDELAKKAQETESELDDATIRIVKAILENLAEGQK